MKYLILLLLLTSCAVGGERVNDPRVYEPPPGEIAEIEGYYWP